MLRQRKYYRLHSSDAEWMAVHSQRKKAERKRRAKKQSTSAIPTVPPPAPQREDDRLLFQKTAIAILGMITLVTGSSDKETVFEVVEQCLERGTELAGQHLNGLNLVWPELFLTPVRAGNDVILTPASP